MAAGDFTLDDLNELTIALASGVLSVRIGDKTVTYQDRSAMLATRELMRRELGVGTRRRGQAHRATFSRGDR